MTDSPRKILIATDAWLPQVNGVVRTLTRTVIELQTRGHAVEVVHPGDFWRLPNPVYPEIELGVIARQTLSRRLQVSQPDHVHISTEGLIGRAVRAECLRRGWHFTTAYHTRFPEYLRAMIGFPESWGYAILKRFHARSSAMMVATLSLERELIARGFDAPIRRWSRGIEGERFHPRPRDPMHPFARLPRPVLLTVGRVSPEKNLAAFLSLNVVGSKVVVGDGPAWAALAKRFPAAHFLGALHGDALSQAYTQADVFVFPSRTDTFGLVLIEALASGLPVAAYPVTGPIDIVTRSELGALHDDLGEAVRLALRRGDRGACAAEGATYTWGRATDQFLENLVPARL